MSDLVPSPHFGASAVVYRAGLLGLWAGAAAGAVVGTILLPVLGTFVGAIVGCPIGGLMGLVNGLALAASVPSHPGPVAARVVPATVSGGVAGLVLIGRLFADGTAALFWVAAVVGCAALGLVLGPRAIRPPTPEGSAAVSPVGRGAGVGVLVGLAIGGGLGVIWGLITYPPTALFAGVEIGAGGAAAGVLFGTLAGIAQAVSRSCRRRRHRNRWQPA